MKKIFVLLVLLVLAGSAFAAGPLAWGSKAPGFELMDVSSGRVFSLKSFEGKKALMVVFICRHCPYVQHIKKALGAVAKDYAGQGVQVVAISSNDANAYAEDAPRSLKEMAAEEGFIFPFLYDESQSVARAYTAMATPDVFIFDGAQKLVYRGQFDDTRPKGKEATGADVRTALDAVLAGKPVPALQKPAIGCSIKWK